MPSSSRLARALPVLTAGVLMSLVPTSGAAAQMPQQSGVVDLLTQSDVPIPGVVDDGELGQALAAAGDFDGDGLADLIAGSDGDGGQGVAWVVLGRPGRGPVDLSAPAPRAVRIDGAGDDGAGSGVAGVGDVDGDGFDDVAVGASSAMPYGRFRAGSIYLVRGRPGEGGDVDLAASDPVLVRIDGAAPDHGLDTAARAGDFDGDGREDLLVSSAQIDNNGRTSSGSVYVLSGDALGGGVIDLAAPGDALLLRIDGAEEFDTLGAAESTAALGDFNGDGRDDIALGAGGAGNNERQSSGSVYVVFGTPATGVLDLLALGPAGLRIDGAAEDDRLGFAVSAAPDLDADGLADVLIGANDAGAGGAAYLVQGGRPAGVLDLADPDAGVLRFDGSAEESAGDAVASPGDVNGDGVGDLLVGAEDADANDRQQSGTVYVVFGSDALPPVTGLADLGDGGFRIDAAQENGFAGELAVGPGDFNGDGRDDVATAGEFTDVGELGDAGRVDVVYGFGPASVAYPGGVSGRAGLPIAPLAPAVARTGLATFSIAPALPAGLLLDAATGRISGAPQEAAAGTHTVTMTDLTGQATAAVSVEIAPAPPGPPGPPAGPPAAPPAAEPALQRLTVTPRCAAFSRRTSVRFRLTGRATVTVAIRRRGDGRCPRRGRTAAAAAQGRRIVRVQRRLGAGARRLRITGLLDGGRLRPGAYVARASVPGGPVKHKRFWVRPRR
ncbi:MAG TPA: putative Ig domain-containing protein [Solirubrobacteraceae bacterium]|nr:putative Ig domain-containing protein [Solirubrobacteraceae bacterium]